MKHLFVPYEIALILKQKGFNEPCLGWYQIVKKGDIDISEEMDGWFHLSSEIRNGNLSSGVVAPLYQQVVDWFREAHDIHISVNTEWNQTGITYFGEIRTLHRELKDGNQSYYEALTQAVTHALTLIP